MREPRLDGELNLLESLVRRRSRGGWRGRWWAGAVGEDAGGARAGEDSAEAPGGHNAKARGALYEHRKRRERRELRERRDLERRALMDGAFVASTQGDEEVRDRGGISLQIGRLLQTSRNNNYNILYGPLLLAI